MFGIYRLALVTPELHPADVDFNAEKIIALYHEAVNSGASLVLFPEFAVTGKSCGALFYQQYLLKRAAAAAEKIAAVTGNVPAVFGLAQLCGNQMQSTIVWAQNGRITASVARELTGAASENIFPAGTVFDCGITVSLEFFNAFPQNTGAVLKLFAGAEALLPGADREHREFFTALSRTGKCAAAGVFAGDGESGTDIIYGGKACFAVNGVSVAAGNDAIEYFDFDAEKIIAARMDGVPAAPAAVKTAPLPEAPDMKYLYNPAHPFLPETPAEREIFCEETLAIQSRALGLRYQRSFAKSFVIGISGGLDSTLALAVLARCCKEFAIPPEKIIAVTMPGFGTTARTRNNAVLLAEIIGATIREIPIAAACEQHFADISHEPENRNSVYENTQARERTQILMDIANQTGGIVVGTGDLSEIALGWCTFNGDHMAMYNVNCSIPKSSIAPLLEHAALTLPQAAADILHDVIATPVSPELLPPDENGNIGQKTEVILGAYELHDYFLWQIFCGVSEPAKLLALAQHAFGEKYPEAELIRVRDLFFRRFFTQQFKRTAAPDGIQAGKFSLSARNAWQMGADITGSLWRS